MRAGQHHLMALMVVVLAIAPAASALAAKAPRRLDPARLLVSIEADGSPRNVRCLSPVAVSLCPTLSKAVAGWKFQPGKRDNAPAAIDVVLNLSLQAVAETKGFSLRATDIELSVRGPTDEDPTPAMKVPEYPRDSQMRGNTGIVEVELFVDPGRPTYRVGRTWFNGKEPTRANLLVDAAIKAAERWPVQPWAPEQRSQCTTFVFVLEPGPTPELEPKACKDTFAEGFAAPTLLMKAREARF